MEDERKHDALGDPLDHALLELTGQRIIVRLRDKAAQVINAKVGDQVAAFAIDMHVDVEIEPNRSRRVVPGLWEFRVKVQHEGREVKMNYYIRTTDILSVKTASLVEF